jgi:hypothetical protein
VSYFVSSWNSEVQQSAWMEGWDTSCSDTLGPWDNCPGALLVDGEWAAEGHLQG